MSEEVKERKPPTYFDKSFKGQYKRMVNRAIKSNSGGKDFHVMLTYRKADGSESTRKVTPYTTKKDVIVGKDHSRDGALRSFKFEGILKMEKTALFAGFEKAAGNIGHAMDLAGLGLLAAPSATHLMGGKDWSEKNKHRAEVVGLGAIAAPVAHEMGMSNKTYSAGFNKAKDFAKGILKKKA